MSRRWLLNLGLLLVAALLSALAWWQPGQKETENRDRVSELAPEQVTAIEIEPGVGADGYRLERRGQSWRLTQPVAVRGDDFKAELLLKLLQAPVSLRRPLADLKPADYGLEGATPQVRFLTANGDALTVQFGAQNPVGLRRYLGVGDHLLLVQDKYLHHVRASWSDWVDRRVLPEGITLVAIDLPDLRLRNEQGKWRVTSRDGKAIAADADAVTRLVDGWRYAYAMKVSLATEAAGSTAQGQRISITWRPGTAAQATAPAGTGDDTPQQTASWLLDGDEDGKLLLRDTTTGLVWQLPASQRQTLLEIAPPQNTAPTPARNTAPLATPKVPATPDP